MAILPLLFSFWIFYALRLFFEFPFKYSSICLSRHFPLPECSIDSRHRFTASAHALQYGYLPAHAREKCENKQASRRFYTYIKHETYLKVLGRFFQFGSSKFITQGHRFCGIFEDPHFEFTMWTMKFIAHLKGPKWLSVKFIWPTKWLQICKNTQTFSREKGLFLVIVPYNYRSIA